MANWHPVVRAYNPYGLDLSANRTGVEENPAYALPLDTHKDYKQRVERLECHFRWRPEGDRDSRVLETTMRRLERHMETEVYTRKPTLALLGYLQFRLGNHVKALDYLDRADAASVDPVAHHITCSFVVRANRLHVMLSLGKEDGATLRLLEKTWREKSSNARFEADLWGAKAMALVWFSRTRFKEAMALFTKARVLDEKSPHWSYGEALVRRMMRDGGSQAQAEIESLVTAEKCLAKATEITNNANPLYLAEHVLCLAEYHHTYTVQSGQREDSLVERVVAEADTARAVAGGRQEVYRLCAVAYKRIAFPNLQRACLDQGIACCEINYDLYHALGTFYANSRSREDKEKAVRLFGLAFDRSPYPGHARAGLDLILLRGLMEPNARLGGELLELEKKFPLGGMDKQYRRDFAAMRSLIMQRLNQQQRGALEF